jgi:hypothetical protein
MEPSMSPEELRRIIATIKAPVDWEDLERGGLLVRIGKTGWYRTPNVHALPDTVMKKVTQVRSGKSGRAELFIPAKWRKAAR